MFQESSQNRTENAPPKKRPKIDEEEEEGKKRNIQKMENGRQRRGDPRNQNYK